jgi:hypothetical protein
VAPVGNAISPLTNLPLNRADVVTTLRIDGVLAGSGVSEWYYDDLLRLSESRDSFDVVARPRPL